MKMNQKQRERAIEHLKSYLYSYVEYEQKNDDYNAMNFTRYLYGYIFALEDMFGIKFTWEKSGNIVNLRESGIVIAYLEGHTVPGWSWLGWEWHDVT